MAVNKTVAHDEWILHFWNYDVDQLLTIRHVNPAFSAEATHVCNGLNHFKWVDPLSDDEKAHWEEAARQFFDSWKVANKAEARTVDGART